MSHRYMTCALLVALTLASGIHAQVDLSTLDDEMTGPRAQVLVLGSVHLSELGDDVGAASLEPLLEHLQAFRPDVITIEAISGKECDLMVRHPALYPPEAVSSYCYPTERIEAATGLDVPTAIAEVNMTLAMWPRSPAPAQRRRLASLFLAANDMPSAATQWLQLPNGERRAGDGLDELLVSMIESWLGRTSESIQVGVELAARLGLERVFSVDDHTGDAIGIAKNEIPAYAGAVQSAWDGARGQRQSIDACMQSLQRRGDMLELYRFINSPEVLRTHVETDFGAAMAGASPPRHYTQMYVAGWETRNLRMVANIREAFREAPGSRVLSIVGLTHKPWFDSLLGQMQGVDIIDVGTVLDSAAKPYKAPALCGVPLGGRE